MNNKRILKKTNATLLKQKRIIFEKMGPFENESFPYFHKLRNIFGRENKYIIF